jgi:hypothetical protein
MNLALVDVIIVTAAAVCAGIAFTVWRFRARPPHDHETTELLKRFFDGKECAICKHPIPPVHPMGLKPGLLNRATHETHSWDEIPNVNLSAALETELPLCSACEVAESFRQRFPNLVVDRDRSRQDAESPDRLKTGS